MATGAATFSNSISVVTTHSPVPNDYGDSGATSVGAILETLRATANLPPRPESDRSPAKGFEKFVSKFAGIRRLDGKFANSSRIAGEIEGRARLSRTRSPPFDVAKSSSQGRRDIS